MAFTLPRLPSGNFTPEQMQVWWQQVVEAIEAQESSQNDLITQLAEAQTALVTTERRLKIGLSYTDPSSIITATDAGSDVTVTVANHTRIYPDGTQIAVAGATFTGEAYGTDYGIYYDDPTCADTTPTMHITTDLLSAQNNFVDGRHCVGVFTTPNAGDPPTDGGTDPTGSSFHNRWDVLP